MKAPTVPGGSSNRTTFVLGLRFTLLLLATTLFLAAPAQAAIPVSLDSPTAFFTNIAGRLLRAEFNLDLNNLQIYPTNQYTPAVHRLLQVTANLYDCTTNRTLGLTPEYPYCPSVFRPLFRRVVAGSNTCIVIAGFREVKDTSMADVALAQEMIDLTEANPTLASIPLYGTPFSPVDTNEIMVTGMPLIIGARKGFPNFNEFSMQTELFISRLLEFRRAVLNGPVVETNQMYVVGISNTFGLEAWNSYLTNYPRELRLDVSVAMTAVLTNEMAVAIFSNCVIKASSLVIPANSWTGWASVPSARSSMVLPFGTTNSFFYLTNSTYLNAAPWFVPQSHGFSQMSGFYVPHWWLNLKTRLLFTLVDTSANRIIDYVNLNRTERTLDIAFKLEEGTGPNLADYKNPANQWITNRLGNSTSLNVPTLGIINQIQAGLNGAIDLLSFAQDPYSGVDAESSVDGFRYNLVNALPIYPKDVGKVFYKSNVFYAPFDPYRSIYIHTTWQANDPLIHFTISDLLDPSVSDTNRVNFVSSNPPLNNLGQINSRYSPWGGNPFVVNPTTDMQLAIKDLGVLRPDDWDFPVAQRLAIEWVGRVHRGTPWQTIFLKSTNILMQTGIVSQGLLTWAIWTGNGYVIPQPNGQFVPNAFLTVPTNDWHLVSLLNGFFNTNDVRNLVSPNQASAQDWAGLLNGLAALTNSVPGQFESIVISSNSPQAMSIARALIDTRAAQPNQIFREVGNILAAPELSLASPFLGLTLPGSRSDEALETIASQLLPLLRVDSIGTAGSGTNYPQLQFTGMEGYSYAVQTSSNLFTWTSISTNVAENGLFYFAPGAGSQAVQFYRSLLLP